MKKIIKEGTKRNITCEECGCLFSFEDEDIYHNELHRNECEKVTEIKAGYKAFVTCPQCETEIVLEQTR